EVGNPIFDLFGALRVALVNVVLPVPCRTPHETGQADASCTARRLKVGHVAPAIATLLLLRHVASSARMKAPRAWQYAQAASLSCGYVPS
ncbi:hypothetical protein HAX54_030742, partial [Datura stramonium]|nr:hypothetical protein [Datura stramonium]